MMRQVVSLVVGGTALYCGHGLYTMKEEIYDNIVMPCAHSLDPELSHNLAVWMLKHGLSPKSYQYDPSSLAVTLQHLHFNNPVGIAAGFDKDGEAVYGLQKIGFGFVEIGSVTPLPQPGNPKPRVFRLYEDNAIINRYGFNSNGHEAVYGRLKQLKRKKKKKCVLGVNLGKNKDSNDALSDYASGLKKFANVADYFVINISSPNTPGLRDWQKKEQLQDLLSHLLEVRNQLKKRQLPLLLLKLSPDLNEQERKDVAFVVTQPQCRIDGLIISNTTVRRDFNLKSIHKHEEGGLSGKPLSDVSTKMIAEMYKLTDGKIPIIGVGGVFSGKDAYEKIKAGASLVQIYTSFAYLGPPVVDRIKRELCELIREDGFVNVSEAVGLSNK